MTTTSLVRLLSSLLIWPLLLIVDFLDTLIDIVFLKRRRDSLQADLPDPNGLQSVETSRTASSISYKSAQTFDNCSATVDSEDSNNIYEMVRRQARLTPSSHALGRREVIAIDEELQADTNKLVQKYRMRDEYVWMSYGEVIARVDHLASGLLSRVGVRSNQSVVLFAETRPEWLICVLACFKIKLHVVTLYSTLGLDALAFGVNQTNASFMITSGASVAKLQRIIHKCDKLKTVVVIRFVLLNFFPKFL